MIIEGSLGVKLPTIRTDGKAQTGRSSDMEKVRREKMREGESQKREDAGARRGRKVVKHYVFPVICGSGGSKSRLAKAAGAEPAGQLRDEKLHAVVARSMFGSENAQHTSASDIFGKLRGRFAVRLVWRRLLSVPFYWHVCGVLPSILPLLYFSSSARFCAASCVSMFRDFGVPDGHFFW